MTTTEYNPFAVAQEQLDEAAEKLGLDEATREFLRWPIREYIVTLPVRMDDGSTRIFRGYRVQYNNSRGPTKGGLRWHPDETIGAVRALAASMTWKTSVMDLPLGGGQGGITCNPKELSRNEQERLARAYMRMVAPVLGPGRDVPAPDVYTTPQVMAWMMDEYETMIGEAHPGVITGKPIALGGSQGRGDASARGGMYVTREAAARLGIELTGKVCAIQGFGDAGRSAALLAEEILHMKVVAVSDSRGGVFNPDGFEAKSLVEHKMRNGRIEGFPGAKPLSNDDLLQLDCTVLFPSAMENVITSTNAPNIKGKIICELASNPTVPEADRILHKNGNFVIPDFLANAGGVTVAYFEQVQNKYNYYWPLDEVHRRLDEKMTKAFNDMFEMYEIENVHPRLAASMVAIQRVTEACKLRGWV